jgi:hypothetical protein
VACPASFAEGKRVIVYADALCVITRTQLTAYQLNDLGRGSRPDRTAVNDKCFHVITSLLWIKNIITIIAHLKNDSRHKSMTPIYISSRMITKKLLKMLSKSE